MPVKVNLDGQTFGRLSVTGLDRRGGFRAWLCRCECGKESVVKTGNLTNGSVQSCGCFKVEQAITHGASYTAEFRVWAGLIGRCENPRNEAFHRYGGRGITVCDRWSDFARFLEDMGARPEGMTIDRVDNNGNYEPGNCRWASMQVQNQNRCTTRFTPDLVREVRRRASQGERAGEIALSIGIDDATVSHVIAFRTWKNVA